MKKGIIFFAFFIVSIFGYSQSNNVVSVAVDKMNVFYVGVDNPVTIAVSGIEATDINVSIDKGTIKYVKPGHYIARVNETGIIKISVTSGKKLFGINSFRCKRLPAPTAFVGSNPKNRKGGTISKSILLALRGVNAIMINQDINITYHVVSCTVTVMDNGKELEASSTSGKFTIKQKELIKNAEIGSKVIISNIKARGPDGTFRKLNSIIFKLM